MKKIIVLTALLFLPLSSAHALSWTSPLRAPLGTHGNPLQIEITNVQDFRPPSYCNYLPNFAAGWSQFNACAPVIAQRNLQDALGRINENLDQQNKLAQETQRWSLFGMLRPIFAPAPVVQIAAPTVAITTPPPASQKPQETQVRIAQPDLWVGAMMEQTGSTFTFRIMLVNNGDADATDVRLTPSSDPSVVNFDGLTNGRWLVGTVAKGAVKELVYTASVGNASGPVVAKFVATSEQPDRNKVDNTETLQLGVFMGGSGGGGGSQ